MKEGKTIVAKMKNMGEIHNRKMVQANEKVVDVVLSNNMNNLNTISNDWKKNANDVRKKRQEITGRKKPNVKKLSRKLCS